MRKKDNYKLIIIACRAKNSRFQLMLAQLYTIRSFFSLLLFYLIYLLSDQERGREKERRDRAFYVQTKKKARMYCLQMFLTYSKTDVK